MTTVNIPGKITAIEVDETPFYSTISVILVPINGAAQYTWASPLIINPSGSPVTTILYDDSAFHNLGGQGPNYLKLSSSFNVNDIVEIYKDPTVLISGSGVLLSDENNNGLQPRSRKIALGASNNWVIL